MTNKRKRITRISKTVDKPIVSPSNNLRVFISYATEDREFVDQISALLKSTFAYSGLEILLDTDIEQGANYLETLEEFIDSCDILLVVYTRRVKSSHSWTGYEIGYFRRSISDTPTLKSNVQRVYMPLCIGAEIPDTLHFIQGVHIKADDLYTVMRTSVPTGAPPVIEDGHPLYRMLQKIGSMIYKTRGDKPNNDGIILQNKASEFYYIVHEYLQNRVFFETFPERKLTIRTEGILSIGKDGVDFTNSRVELVGDFSALFGVSESMTSGHDYSWNNFNDIIPNIMRNTLTAGIKRLAGNIMTRAGDNYHVVTTLENGKSYRLFVSKAVTYVSKKSEIDIYIVEIFRKSYGNPLTTRLLKAIEVGARLRFLLLEDESEFRPEKLDYPSAEENFTSKVLELIVEIELILREAAHANLRDPEFLIYLFGKGKQSVVATMIDVWAPALANLNSAADAVLSPGQNKEAFRIAKRTLIKTLEEFCIKINEINKNYTTQALQRLSEILQRVDGAGADTIHSTKNFEEFND